MKTCIIALNNGHDLFMGYACSHEVGKVILKGSNSPVFKPGKNILMGVIGNEKLLTDMKIVPLIMKPDNSPEQNIAHLRNNVKLDYKGEPQILVLTSNNFIYRWRGGLVDMFGEYDEEFVAIGEGMEIALGAMHGNRSSRMTAKERVEVALQAVKRYYPHLGANMGVLSL
jgi:ATP-dependent protease HslVU (ClpYQ) peptidase subunit